MLGKPWAAAAAARNPGLPRTHGYAGLGDAFFLCFQWHVWGFEDDVSMVTV